jgi:hypothetical protein
MREERVIKEMPVVHRNRKGRTYYLCESTTKTGKPRYYFSRERGSRMLTEIPQGYEIRESVNGVVSLTKMRRREISASEIAAVMAAVRMHSKASRYRVDTKSSDITIYESIGPDGLELAAELGLDTHSKNTLRRIEERERSSGQFSPMMRFILTDKQRRLFTAQRMCFLRGKDDWIYLQHHKPISKLARQLVPVLGTDQFFELF